MTKRVVLLMMLSQSILILCGFVFKEDINSLWAKEEKETSYVVTATIYHPEPRQCDADYTITADGSKIDTANPSGHRWIAVSRDMLCRQGGMLKFGDRVRVEGTHSRLDGVHIVRDVMNKRYRRYIDFLVSKNDIHGKWEGVKIVKI